MKKFSFLFVCILLLALCATPVNAKALYGATDIGQNAFDSCPNLQSITLPRTIAHITENAFLNCYHLES